MHTGFVCKRPWCSDWHIKGNWKIEAIRHKAIELDQLLNLTGCGNTNGIRQANALHSCINDGIKDGQQVNQVAAKCIFSGKAHIASGGSDESNQGHSITKHLFDTSAMTECAKLCRCSIKEIQTENRCIQCSLYISLNTTHMCDNARAQAKFT